MLLFECPVCGRRELRSTRSIETLEHTDHGIVVTMTCSACGHRGRSLTGAGRRDPMPQAS